MASNTKKTDTRRAIRDEKLRQKRHKELRRKTTKANSKKS